MPIILRKNHPHPDNDNWDEAVNHSGQDARVTRGRDARDTINNPAAHRRFRRNAESNCLR
jgi:hypothetical protein